MADIRSKIKDKYKIDLAEENIVKLYGIKDANISDSELRNKFSETRKKWENSVKMGTEKAAKRDQARLDKAGVYETILLDKKLFGEVFAYYNKSGSGEGSSQVESARQYFKLIATTKKIRKSDVEFYNKYYKPGKNKKAIIDMLKKEFKVQGIGKDKESDNEEESKEEKKKQSNSHIIKNLFEESTVITIQEAVRCYEQVCTDPDIQRSYPNIDKGFYSFVEIENIESIKQLEEIVLENRKKANDTSTNAVDSGKANADNYRKVVDLFNKLADLVNHKDVADNIEEFKLLMRYPKLTPYMFAFIEMKPDTMQGIVEIAKNEYGFLNVNDFILEYYDKVHDNFGISDKGISAILKKARGSTKKNKILNAINKKRKKAKEERMAGNNPNMNLGYSILFWLLYVLAYWPLYLTYLTFEIVKMVITRLNYLTIPTFLLVFGFENWKASKLGANNIFVLRKIFMKKEWRECVTNFWHQEALYSFEFKIQSFIYIIVILSIFVILPLFASIFMSAYADEFNKGFDWIGIDRSFKQISKLTKINMKNLFKDRKAYIKSKIQQILINTLSIVLIIVILNVIKMY